jgi:hypothetical protein
VAGVVAGRADVKDWLLLISALGIAVAIILIISEAV